MSTGNPASAATGPLASFRQEARTWLETACPPSMRRPGPPEELIRGGSAQVFANPESKLWLERMAERGWTAPGWPRAYGGGGLSPAEQAVLQEELDRIHARSPLQSLDLRMIGPTLLEYGTPWQKDTFLPPITRGKVHWCQGYSEPGAGSDLASLRTRAESRGDEYLVNGAKIWTSYAGYADWMFALVRTDINAPKHQGISFLLLDMKSPGISTTPIELISGHSPFCQVFFDDVRVPKRQLLGTENAGWEIAKKLLQFERQMIAGLGTDELGGESLSLPGLARRYGETDVQGRLTRDLDRQHIARHRMNDRAFALTVARDQAARAAGTANDHLSSIFKYYGTEQNKRLYELALGLMGTRALGWQGDTFDSAELDVTRQWLRSKANSIEGGSSEIQLNVIAKRILNLPD
ncbi:MAG: acyl-CoA dehydrogenase family protein [Pseudomonadota bacterium]